MTQVFISFMTSFMTRYMIIFTGWSVEQEHKGTPSYDNPYAPRPCAHRERKKILYF
jgi:hypothetical protein